ncbi:MAG: hypothetical protein PXX83_07805 [Candidatus Nitrosotalea sp.]|nr:hypothetical protein [Candidatus Nitrosotalea sp.]
MKTIHLSIIIGTGIITAIITGIMIMSGILDMTGQNSNHAGPYGFPDGPYFTLFFNGSGSYSGPIQFEARQGQNITLLVNVTSTPENLPVTLYTEPHIGFTATNGMDLKLSSTHVTTPSTVLLHVSIGKDATPNKYRTRVFATTMNDTLGTDVGITVNPQNFSVQVSKGVQVDLTNVSVWTCGSGQKIATFVDTGGFVNITKANEPGKGLPSDWNDFFDFVLKPNSTGYVDMSFEFGGENYNIGNTSFGGTTQSSLWVLNHNTISKLFNKTAIYTLDDPYSSPHIGNLNGISIFATNIDNVTNHTLRLTYVIKIDPSAKEGTYGLGIPYSCPIELLTVGNHSYTGSIPWHRSIY